MSRKNFNFFRLYRLKITNKIRCICTAENCRQKMADKTLFLSRSRTCKWIDYQEIIGFLIKWSRKRRLFFIFAFPVTDAGLIVPFQRRRKKVRPVALGDKIKIINSGWIKSGLQGIEAGIADGARREAADNIRIIGRITFQMTALHCAVKVFQIVNGGRITLQTHFSFQPVVEHR